MNRSWKVFFVVLLGACLFAAAPDGWPFDATQAAKRQADAAKELSVPKQLSVDLGKGVPLKLMLIPAGKFMMGEAAPPSFGKSGPAPESTLHEVTIARPFYIGVYKITQEQYEKVMGVNPSQFPGKNHPVDSATWDDAVRFCEKASSKINRKVSLPTEEQWEYAARAGTATRFTFGDDDAKVDDYAWYRENANKTTHPVGQKPPNAWGLYDIHGLLWEYCTDLMNPTSAVHASRGGTYGSRPPALRLAGKMPSPAADATKDILNHYGFRVVVDIEGAAKKQYPK